MDETQPAAVGQGGGASGQHGARLVQVSTMGNLGNRMIQYMAALALGARVAGARYSRIHLPEWGIQIPPVADCGRTEVVQAAVIGLERLSALLCEGVVDCVDIRSYAQDLRNFGRPGMYAQVFHSPSVRGAGAGELLCNIRQGDILDARHPDYVLLPIDFYAEVASRTGLAPVFMGQLDDSAYLRALRRRFPAARYVPSQGAAADFAFIRASAHIVPAISTFSWLAAWMSDAESVHLPVLGLFNPRQAPATNLLPFDDPRYRFTLFPHHYAVPVADFERAHAAVRQLWRAMPADALRAMLARPVPPRDPGMHMAAFDEAFYLHAYADIAGVVRDGHMPSGRHHYEHHGYAEGRQGFAIDAAWYCREYPIAAIELGEGLATDVSDHWVRFGRARGYARTG